ncbi:MAG: hypothetical protein ACRD43_03905 [Pyrinomonadaceae bacterium]
MSKVCGVLLLLVLVGGGAHAQTHSSASSPAVDEPKAQALKLYQIIQKQDWEGLFYLIQCSPKIQNDLKDLSAPAFAEEVRRGIKESNGEETVNNLFSGMTDIAVGEVSIDGNKADVTTSSKAVLNGKTFAFNGVAHMIKVGSVWKWDLTFSDDLSAATSQQTQALLGTPTEISPKP